MECLFGLCSLKLHRTLVEVTQKGLKPLARRQTHKGTSLMQWKGSCEATMRYLPASFLKGSRHQNNAGVASVAHPCLVRRHYHSVLSTIPGSISLLCVAPF